MEIPGLAWSGRGRVVQVDVSTDGGSHGPRLHTVKSRLTDRLDTLPVTLVVGWPAGQLAEPSRRRNGLCAADPSAVVEARGLNSFYHFNGIQTWEVARQWGGQQCIRLMPLRRRPTGHSGADRRLGHRRRRRRDGVAAGQRQRPAGGGDLRPPGGQVPRGHGRGRTRGPAAGRRHRVAEHRHAAQDGRQLLAVAPVLFDYIHRAMPADNPQSLTPDEVYALCAYLLYLNGIVPRSGHGCADAAAGGDAQPCRIHQSRSPTGRLQRRSGTCLRTHELKHVTALSLRPVQRKRRPSGREGSGGLGGAIKHHQTHRLFARRDAADHCEFRHVDGYYLVATRHGHVGQAPTWKEDWRSPATHRRQYAAPSCPVPRSSTSTKASSRWVTIP